MDVIIGSARIDENGKIKGGKAGDNNGREVSTQKYYNSSKGWVGLRAKDSRVAAKLAAAMLEACNNDNIGYDQNQRTGVITELRKVGSLIDIKVKTEADCSSLVRACVIQATGIDPGNFNTATEKKMLLATGLFEEVAINKAPDCITGDVLVTKTKGHTVIVTKGAADIFFEPIVSHGSVTASALHVRRGPSTKYAHVRYLHKGDKVTIFAKIDGWAKIGTDEYASMKYIKED